MDVRSVSEADVNEAAEVLAKAFQKDAGMQYILPEADHRAQTLPSMFRVMLRHGRSAGEVESLGNPMQAVAIWLPPDKTAPSSDDMEAAGISEVASQFGDEAMGRLGTLVGYLEGIHNRLMTRPHWRLFFLGVDPRYQGRGLGGSLMRPKLEALQRHGQSCYLDTLEARNVRFYERHGFRIVDQGILPETSVTVWAMVIGS